MTLKQLLRYVIFYFVLLIVPDEPVASTSSISLGKRKQQMQRTPKGGPKKARR